MSGPATYGQLMDQAAWRTARGLTAIAHHSVGGKTAAYAAIGEWVDLLRALEAHTWAVLDPRRVPQIRATATPDPRERAAVEMIDTLAPVVGPHRQLPARDPESISAWAGAARSVRAATDLLATHRHPTRATARTPDVAAVLGDPATRQAALARVGDITAALLAGERDLALRAVQAGLSRRRVTYLLGGHPDAEAAARDVAGLGPAPHAPHLEDLTVASPAVHTEDPVQEVADRMLRIRRAAWALPGHPHPSVETVKAVATLAVAVHAHTLAARGHPPTRPAGDVPADPGTARLVDRARAWAGVTREVYAWRTPAPVDPVVAADVRAVATALRSLAPLTGPRPDLHPADAARVRQVLAGAVDVTGDLAAWSATALGAMAATGQLHVPARSLTGDQVSDDPRLVEAKLTDRLAPAPPAAVTAVTTTLATLATRPDPRTLGAGGLTLRAAPLDASVAPAAAGHDPIHRAG